MNYMAEEKIITINLRKSMKKTPKWRRAKEGMNILREILKKNSNTEKIKIDKSINERIWSRSIKNPPSRIRLKISKIDDKTSKVELVK